MSISYEELFSRVSRRFFEHPEETSTYRIYHGQTSTVVQIPALQGAYMEILYDELNRNNMRINCKCGIELPIPYYQIVGDTETELVCHLCQLGYVHASESQIPESIKQLLVRIRNIPICEHVPDVMLKTSNGIKQTCRSCLHLFKNDNIMCHNCDMCIYTSFDHIQNEHIFCSRTCKASHNIAI